MSPRLFAALCAVWLGLLLVVASLGWPSVASAQAEPGAQAASADCLSGVILENDQCLRVGLVIPLFDVGDAACIKAVVTKTFLANYWGTLRNDCAYPINVLHWASVSRASPDKWVKVAAGGTFGAHESGEVVSALACRDPALPVASEPLGAVAKGRCVTPGKPMSEAVRCVQWAPSSIAPTQFRIRLMNGCAKPINLAYRFSKSRPKPGPAVTLAPGAQTADDADWTEFIEWEVCEAPARPDGKHLAGAKTHGCVGGR